LCHGGGFSFSEQGVGDTGGLTSSGRKAVLPLRCRRSRALSPPGMCIEISIDYVFEFAYIIQEVVILHLVIAGGQKQQNALLLVWLLPGVWVFGPCIDILVKTHVIKKTK